MVFYSIIIIRLLRFYESLDAFSAPFPPFFLCLKNFSIAHRVIKDSSEKLIKGRAIEDLDHHGTMSFSRKHGQEGHSSFLCLLFLNLLTANYYHHHQHNAYTYTLYFIPRTDTLC